MFIQMNEKKRIENERKFKDWAEDGKCVIKNKLYVI